MNTIEIQKLLHHRPPYLMVSEVLELSDTKIKTTKTHEGYEAHLSGHFPGAPVVPGAMLQELCTQSAGILITKYHSPVESYDSEMTKGHALGVLNKVERAKFYDIAKPNKKLICEVELIEKNDMLFKFKASVHQEDKLKAKIYFNLINTSDEILY